MINELLGSLCNAINKREFKSKQACFNHYLRDVIEAKKSYSWEDISHYMNKNTNSSLSSETYRMMYKRAISKTTQKETPNEQVKATKENTHSTKITKEDKEDKNRTPKVDNELLDKYLQVCFNKVMIAQEAIDNNVSIETIRSWNCANFVQLSNTLGKYIRNKR